MIGLTFPLPALFAPMTAAPSAEPAVQAPARHVVFSHGQESGPWGRKISALAEVARSEGYDTHSVDYRGIDEPRARVARLVDFCKELTGDLVPFEHSMRFAQAYRATLHLVESDHRLHNQIRVIKYLFEYFLVALDLPAIAFE